MSATYVTESGNPYWLRPASSPTDTHIHALRHSAITLLLSKGEFPKGTFQRWPDTLM